LKTRKKNAQENAGGHESMTRLEDDYLGYRATYEAAEVSTSLSASSSQLD